MFELISNENEIYEFYFIAFATNLNLRYENLNLFKRHQHLPYFSSMHLIRYCNIVNDAFLNYSLIKTDGDILFLLATDFSKDNIVLFLKWFVYTNHFKNDIIIIINLFIDGIIYVIRVWYFW